MDFGRLLNSLRLVGLRAVVRALVPIVVAAGLLVLVIANVRVRASWLEAEDGVLWVSSAEGVVARELSRDGAGARAGLAVDDLLVAVDGRRSTSPPTSSRRSTPRVRATRSPTPCSAAA